MTVWATATYGQEKALNLFEYRVIKGGTADANAGASGSTAATAVSVHDHPGLTVMTFNVWNTNPPSWLMQSGESRFERYSERMDLLAEVALKDAPAIIAFQEVRRRRHFCFDIVLTLF